MIIRERKHSDCKYCWLKRNVDKGVMLEYNALIESWDKNLHRFNSIIRFVPEHHFLLSIEKQRRSVRCFFPENLFLSDRSSPRLTIGKQKKNVEPSTCRTVRKRIKTANKFQFRSFPTETKSCRNDQVKAKINYRKSVTIVRFV